MDVFADDNRGENHVQLLGKSHKIGKITKLIRLFRIIKIFKIFRNKRTLAMTMQKALRINSSTERLLTVFFIFAYCQHVFACCWVIMGQMQDSPDSWYNDEFK